MILGPIKRKKEKEAAEKKHLDSVTDSMGMSLKQTLGGRRTVKRAAVHKVAERWTQLRELTTTAK